ncbi:MAG: hypothetical protein QM479_12480 [Pseudomonadota bacterium]
MIQFKPGYSFNTLIQLLVFSIILAVLIIISLPFLKTFYFSNQLTSTGLLINGSILGLFFIGLIKIVYLLFHYWREEKSLNQFLINLNQAQPNLSLSVNPKSLIILRYKTMADIHKQKSTINQSALASIMVAYESTYLSLPRFISNILILCGVFGTIISLAIALSGASNLLENNSDISGMGTVIHGMSTALSTTTTAIICYLFFGYFFQRLTDIQTYLFSSIELVTTQHLMPRFNHQGDNIMFHLTELVSSLNQTAISMQSVQQQLLSASQKADNLMSKYDMRINNMANNVSQISDLLRQGFRLPEQKKEITHPQQNSSRSPILSTSQKTTKKPNL